MEIKSRGAVSLNLPSNLSSSCLPLDTRRDVPMIWLITTLAGPQPLCHGVRMDGVGARSLLILNDPSVGLGLDVGGGGHWVLIAQQKTGKSDHYCTLHLQNIFKCIYSIYLTFTCDSLH